MGTSRWRCRAVLLVSLILIPAALPAQNEAQPDSARLQAARQLMALLADTTMVPPEIEANLRAVKLDQIAPELFAELLAEVKAQQPIITTFVAQRYAHYLTLEELTGLLAFYQTPLGRRVAAVQLLITRETMELSRQRGQELMARLMGRIQMRPVPPTS